MITYKRGLSFVLPLLGALMCFVPYSNTFAQSEKISLDFTLAPALEKAQVLGLTSLGVDSRGSGPVLISGTLINNTSERLDNLYFEFEMQAASVGVIAKVSQQAAYPFSLEPNQVVFATNNDIDREELPGIDDKMKFEGGLTSSGEDFVETLGGTTTLPNDIYTFSVTIYQVTNALGRQTLASQVIELGGSFDGAIVDELNIYLKAPGDVVGSEVNITNPFPQFSWEGEAANTYRVIVVNDNGQDSPETLIQSAKSSEPTNTGGSLLQFENLDYTVEGNSLQFPSSGVQALVSGQKYYWQVTTSIQTAIGEDEIVSDIWTFRLLNPGDTEAVVEMDQSVYNAIIQLVGEDKYSELVETGYGFESIEIDDQVFTGIVGIQKIAEIIRKIEDGDIILNDN